MEGLVRRNREVEQAARLLAALLPAVDPDNASLYFPEAQTALAATELWLFRYNLDHEQSVDYEWLDSYRRFLTDCCQE